jgi:uncharacterized membrane protein
MSPRRYRVKRPLLFLSILVTASAAIASIVWWTGRPGVRSLEREVERELRPGSSISQVIAFLDARHIEHSDRPMAEKSSARYMPDGRRVEPSVMTGVIHNTYGPLPAEERIVIVFYFEEGNGLIDHEIRVHQIAP